MTNYRFDYDKWEEDSLKNSIDGHHEKKIKNPKHYKGLGIEPLDYIIANKMDFLEGNIIKYITRYPNKGGVKDLIKAREYIDKLIERERA
tara:strand:- start:198 stop:467 length:270 start_codon:yes stop_codon:yes gene_type:complete